MIVPLLAVELSTIVHDDSTILCPALYVLRVAHAAFKQSHKKEGVKTEDHHQETEGFSQRVHEERGEEVVENGRSPSNHM